MQDKKRILGEKPLKIEDIKLAIQLRKNIIRAIEINVNKSNIEDAVDDEIVYFMKFGKVKPHSNA